MKYWLLGFIIILGCKYQSEKNLVGKWKVKSPDITSPRRLIQIEFSNNIFIVDQSENGPLDTFEYVMRGDTLIFNKAGDDRIRTGLIQFYNNDSAMILVSPWKLNMVRVK